MNQYKVSLKLTYIFIILCILVAQVQSIRAQVTIGANIKSQEGALLDLKEHSPNAANVTSERGMTMPRVLLTSKTNLFPMFDSTSAEYQGENKDKQDQLHTALLVYNVNTVEEEQLTPGLYVWNGQSWLGINIAAALSTAPNPYEDDNVLKGISGNVYKTRTFGKAGEWMIENLRETEYDTDISDRAEFKKYIKRDEIHGEPQFDYNHNYGYNYSYPFYTYPEGDKDLFESQPEYGLLYSLYMTTKGQATERVYEDDFIEARERERSHPSVIQGICPNGWVVPSDYDWSVLRSELMENPDLYSTLNKDDGRSKAGLIAKSPKAVKNSTIPIEGASKEDGLNILLVGQYSNGNYNSYGYMANFWSSSAIYTKFDRENDFSMGSSRVLYSNYNGSQVQKSMLHQSMYSVRCKKLDSKK